MLNVGKLYSCSEYFLMLYPDKKTAVDAGRLLGAPARQTAQAAAELAYWSKRLGKPVNYCDPRTPLLVLSMTKKKTYIEVLVGDKRGWFVNDGWLEFKEIVEDYED